jgi:hypothetical protein
VLWLTTNKPFSKLTEIDQDTIKSLPENGILHDEATLMKIKGFDDINELVLKS